MQQEAFNLTNISLLHPSFQNGSTIDFIKTLGLSLDRVVIGITENQPSYDFAGMRTQRHSQIQANIG